MNGQMMNYDRYLESLKNTPIYTGNIPSVKIDYRGLIAYAREKGVSVHELSDEEKQPFVAIPLSELHEMVKAW